MFPAFKNKFSGKKKGGRLTNRLRLYLVKPSKYDDDGYVIRHWKGVFPSNTLACLYGLSRDVEARKALGKHLKFHIEAVDEAIQRVPTPKIIRASREKRTKAVVCLVGVQSNQFPRAADLALEFRRAGLDVLIGGFHVGGALSTLSELPREIQALKEAGVTIVAGEVENRWESILRDALCGTLKPVYNFLSEPADLSDAPLPQIPKNLLNRYAVRHFATLDCSRGCPFGCSFCAVINVHGRRMRFRPVEAIEKLIRENYRLHKIRHYFFTDDNFCRNQNWEGVFDLMIRLREEEHIALTCNIQVDVQSYLIPNFVEKAARAGCSQVFIGMESLNQENLEAVGKKQNLTANFQALTDAYHNAGIATHLAYIIGFPYDSEVSVRDDMAHLRELGAGQASFFMLMPLPGSADYRAALARGLVMDADLSNFDSFHETFCHSKLKSGSWTRSYEHAWKSFYSFENMKGILKKANPKRYWGIFLNFLWCKNAIQVEGGHPLLHGFLRQKSQKERSKLYPVESLPVYFKRRLKDAWQILVGWFKLALEMEEVWLATRKRSALEEQVLLELFQYRKRATEWRNFRLSELQTFYRKAAGSLERSYQRRISSSIRIPSRFQLWLKKLDFFSDSLTFTRHSMNEFWKNCIHHLRQGKINRIHPFRVALTGFRELALFFQFFLAISRHSY